MTYPFFFSRRSSFYRSSCILFFLVFIGLHGAGESSTPLDARRGAPVPLDTERTSRQTESSPPRLSGEKERASALLPRQDPSSASIVVQAKEGEGSAPPSVSTAPAATPPPRHERRVRTPDRPTARNPLEIVRHVSCPQNTTLYELSNGLTVFVHERSGMGPATVRIFVRNTGSANEGEYSGSGISHLLEHLVAGGATATRDRAEIKSIRNTLGDKYNAWTSKDLTAYYIDCASGDLPVAIDLLADIVNRSTLDKSQFDSEKGVVRQEMLDGHNDRGRVGAQLLSETFYRHHTRRNPVVGHADLFDALTLEDVRHFYALRYVPNNQIVVVAGDIKPDQAIKEVIRAWKDIPRGHETVMIHPEEPLQLSRREAIREMSGETCDLTLAWSGVALSDPDTYPLDVLALIMTHGEMSRLVERVQRKSQWAIGIQAFNDTPDNVRGAFIIRASSTGADLAKLQSEILDEVYRMKEFPVSGQELARAKKQVEAAFVFGQESVYEMATMIAQDYIATGDPDFHSRYLDGIRSVTIEDIRRVARKYFRPETLTRVLITPPGMSPQQVEARRPKIDDDIQAIRFPESKLRLLTKKSNACPIVNIRICVLAGALVDTDAVAGRSAVLAEMLDKGSRKYSRNDIAKHFDSIGSQLSIRAGRNTIIAETTVLKDDLPDTLAIMFDAIFMPLLSEEEFQKAKKNITSRIQSRTADPMAELMDLFSASLPTVTPYHMLPLGNKESVAALDLEDLRRFHADTFHPANMVVSIFGDFEPSEAAGQLDRLLKEKKFAATPPSIPFDRTNELIQPIIEHRKTDRTMALGVVAWPTVSVHNTKEIATLTVIQAILGGYHSAGGRLFDELRSEGLAYLVHVDQITGPVPGYFFVQFATKPGRIPVVVSMIDKQIAAIQQGTVTDEELKKAKERIVAVRPLMYESLASKSLQSSLDELYGVGFANFLSFDTRIQNVTLEDVVAAARRYFRQKIVVTTSPEAKIEL